VAPLEVIPASPNQEPILDNLLQLYAHDFSEFHDVDLAPDGRFVYKNLPLYWREPNRHPLLLRWEGKLAGFVFVKKGSEISGKKFVWDMAEFFVLRAYRRHGLGTAAAHQVWRRFPGPWEVRVMESNVAAHQFWARAVETFAGSSFGSVSVERGGERWHVFSFESAAGPK